MLTTALKRSQTSIISVLGFWFVLASTSTQDCLAASLLSVGDFPQNVAAKVEKQDSTVSEDAAPGRLLLFVEQDQDGNSDTLATRPYTIDINSRVVVQIDKQLLARRIEASARPSALPADLLAELSALQAASQQGIKGLEPLAADLKAWSSTKTHTPDQIRTLQSSLSKVAAPTVLILQYAKEGSRLRSRINTAFESFEGRPTIAEQYKIVFGIAQEELDQLRSQWDAYLRSEGIYVQLGAWLATSHGAGPLHLRGFDTYREGDYLEVERFNLRAAFGEQQKNELERVTAQARQINNEGLVKTIERSALSSAEATFTEVLACVDKIAASVDTLRWIQEESLRTIRGQSKTAKTMRLPESPPLRKAS